MATISDRLREIIGQGSVHAFAKRCEVSGTAMRQYLEGSIPSADKAARIASQSGVNLQWLVTGEGPKYPEPVRPAGDAAIDPELLGRVIDRISRVYRDERVHLADVELGRLAAVYYAELLDFSADPEERMVFLDLIGVRVRKAIRAAAADPANVKRQA